MKNILLLILVLLSTCNKSNSDDSLSDSELKDLRIKYLQYYSVEDSLKSVLVELDSKAESSELNYIKLLIRVRLKEYGEALNLVNTGDVFPKVMTKFQSQLITGYLTEIVSSRELATKYYSESLSYISNQKFENDLYQSTYLLLTWLISDNNIDKQLLISFVKNSNTITILSNQPEIDRRDVFIKNHLPEML